MSQDDFDLPSLAAYLGRNPDQVRKMADRDQIPGRRIGGEWKFSKAAIHHWLEEQIGESDENELVKVEQVLGRAGSATDDHDSIVDLLVEGAVAIPLIARTKNSVINSICELAANAGMLWDPDKMAEAIRSREQLHPTALENGVALLHSRRPLPSIIGQPFLSLGITSSGIPFGGPRGVLTDVFFLIGSTSEAEHLRTLARLSRILQRDGFLTKLREAADAKDAIQTITEHARDLES